MSTYTTQLRYICEQYAGRTESADYRDTPAVIAAARPKIFDFPYPLYDPTYKAALETKIINHYYFREIGEETAAQFKFQLARTMNEIMPFYNDLYKSADIEFNPLYDVDYYKDHAGSDNRQKHSSETGLGTTRTTENGTTSDTTEFTGTTETTTEGSRSTEIDSTNTRTLNLTDTDTVNLTDTKTNNTTDTKTYNTKDTVRRSDTPQGGLTGIEANTYLSEATITDKTGTEAIARTGTETTAKTGTDTVTHTGTDTAVLDETQEATESSSATQESESTTTESGTSSKTGQTVSNDEKTGSENIDGTDKYLDHVYGKMGGVSYSEMLMKYRESLINIDMMIINDLEVCFMNIY